MVSMQNVRKVYENSNTVALDNVSLTIEDGEFVFLVLQVLRLQLNL